ncbi:hypothetical protein E1293_22695 [Actinomadura darangshiensis]|uniref:Uncharacterized protein n=1 Tax=Actinomadura darangshiensis TaxID=705336 RepID=A0A4R5B531_9ACTN|nr:hypothetical protein [Actinomadura darangshiensis]TDD79690.1 hypothetical protein E1293_22695 [Actinomadura darangshiensis]
MTLTRTDPPHTPPRLRLLRERSVWIAAAGWLAGCAAVLAIAGDALPFDWPHDAHGTPGDRLVEFNTRLLEVLVLMGIVYWLTRRRPRPDLAARSPERAVALRETLGLLAYGAAGLGVGYVLARALGWHPFALHLAGSLYGTHDDVTPAEAVTWAVYNVVVYAAVPLLYFRRRYSSRELNLVSADRRGDAKVIAVILLIESAVQYLAMHPGTFDLGARQLALGLPLTFALYFAGAVLPAMVFIYCVLVPRFARLTGSTATTVILGGLTYAALHLWDAWTMFDSPAHAALSVLFLLATYFGPGMFKTWLTVRTGNAWVHVWAYHALAPHTLADTPLIARVFRLC